MKITYVMALSWFGRWRALWLPGCEPMVAGGPGGLGLATPCLTLTLSWVLSTICTFYHEKVVGQKALSTRMLTIFVGQV